MERLQAAIEKAREQRNAGVPRRDGAAPQGIPDVDAAWAALPEVTFSRRFLNRNRIVAFQNSSVSAPYDIMRTRMIQQCQANDWRRIAVASPHSSCGKTTTVANLAFGLARHHGVRTVVMDFDLRRSGLGELLGQPGQRPMADLLEGRAPFSAIARRHGDSLAFGLGRGSARNPAEILQNQRTEVVLQEIEATYRPDYMIFDLPPLSAGDDNLGFLSRVDAVLILAEAERTTPTQLDVAERQIAELTNVMGVVLNKCRHTSGAYGYEEGYY